MENFEHFYKNKEFRSFCIRNRKFRIICTIKMENLKHFLQKFQIERRRISKIVFKNSEFQKKKCNKKKQFRKWKISVKKKEFRKFSIKDGKI